MKVLTNFPFHKVVSNEVKFLAWNSWRSPFAADLIVVNIDQRSLLIFALLKWVVPFLKFRLVSVDILLRSPSFGFRGFLVNRVKRILFQQVDLFILYFRATSGYEKQFGILREKICYIPFKVNSWEKLRSRNPDEGAYVLCAGRTLRDLKTFLQAMKISGAPGVLLVQAAEEMRRHGTILDDLPVPPNVRVETHSDGREDTFLRWIEGARIVVVPRFRGDIASTGISTYLCAMALRRPVVISSGPGAEDVLLNGEASIVPPEDAAALASAIDGLWGDPNRRRTLTNQAFAYASSLEGEDRLLRDLWKAASAGLT